MPVLSKFSNDSHASGSQARPVRVHSEEAAGHVHQPHFHTIFESNDKKEELVSFLTDFLQNKVKELFPHGPKKTPTLLEAKKLADALRLLNAQFKNKFKIPIQYLDGEKNISFVLNAFIAAVQNGTFTIAFLIANCPKLKETLLTALADNLDSLDSSCASVKNLLTLIAAAVLDDAGWQQFSSGQLGPLSSSNLAIFGADRTPFCPMNCTAAKQCKLCISDDVTGIAADCLIATMVAAMRYAGFKVAMLALGNEGARCVFGDKVSTVQGNYGHYPNYLAAHTPLLNPSAACGLDYCLHEILGCADLLAEFPLVTQGTSWWTSTEVCECICPPPMAAAAARSDVTVRANLMTRMDVAIGLCRSGFGGSKLSSEQILANARAGGLAAVAAMTLAMGGDLEDRSLTMACISQLGVEARKRNLAQLTPAGRADFLAKSGLTSASNSRDAAIMALKEFQEFNFSPRCREVLLIYIQSAVKDGPVAEKFRESKILVAEKAIEVETVIAALGGGVPSSTNSRFSNVSPWKKKVKGERTPLSSYRGLILVLETLGVKNWEAVGFLLTDWKAVRANLVKAGYDVDSNDDVDDYEAVKKLEPLKWTPPVAAQYGIRHSSTVAKTWRDMHEAAAKFGLQSDGSYSDPGKRGGSSTLNKFGDENEKARIWVLWQLHKNGIGRKQKNPVSAETATGSQQHQQPAPHQPKQQRQAELTARDVIDLSNDSEDEIDYSNDGGEQQQQQGQKRQKREASLKNSVSYYESSSELSGNESDFNEYDEEEDCTDGE